MTKAKSKPAKQNDSSSEGSLREKAIVVRLKVRAWSGRRRDRQVATKAEEMFESKRQGAYQKMLVDKKELQVIHRSGEHIRGVHYEMTLPWGDNGDRLLPNTIYFDYLKRMKQLTKEHQASCEQFFIKYPGLKADSKRAMGAMYKESDYPDINQLREKFVVSMEFEPIPDTQDIRLSLNEEEKDFISRNAEETIKRRFADAQKHIYDKIKEALSHMVDRLEGENVFRDSLVDNMRELIELMPKLNFSEDKSIAEICDKMKTLLVPAQELRDNSTKRVETQKRAKQLMKDYF